MNPTCLTHIVPSLPPQIDGVGDYALHLARYLRDQYGIEGRFIVCDPDWDGPSRVDDFTVRRLRLRNEAGIWGLLASNKSPGSAVLLHYVSYGYHKRGIPVWLYRGVNSWMQERNPPDGRRHFSTVFHELWPTSWKPWTSVFYLSCVQKWLVQGLHRRSAVSVTSTKGMKAVLDGIQPHKTVWLPIPSNVPVIEPTEHRPVRGAKLRVAIFGQQWSRSATIRAHSNLLQTLDRNNLLASAMVIGKGLNSGGRLTLDIENLHKCVSPSRIEVLGELRPEQVSRALAGADLFLSHYPGEWACKSGTFMAALAAGCPAVLHDGKNASPLSESEHFLASDDTPPSVERLRGITEHGHLERIAVAGRQWYEQYADWKVIARRYQELLVRVSESPTLE